MNHSSLPTLIIATLCLLSTASCIFGRVEAPYFGMSYYQLTFDATDAIVETERSAPNTANLAQLTTLAWRTNLLAAVQAARNGGIHPSEIPASLLTRLGIDPSRYPTFGEPECSASADIGNSDFEVPGDETNLGGVVMTLSLQSTNSCSLPSSQRPNHLHFTGPHQWTNGDTLTVPIFQVRVDGTDWTTQSLANKVTVQYTGANNRGAGALWFVAADQTQGSGWINDFETLLIAPSAGFILEE